MTTRTDTTEQFLNRQAPLEPTDTFVFACHPQVSCFNACCSDLNLILTPLDVMRLRRQLDLPSKIFFDRFAKITIAPDTGLPLLKLRMAETTGRPCPFVSPSGCTAYPARPGACRIYPVGRATTMEHGQVIERFFLIREPHCQGFMEKREWNPTTWMADQDVVEDGLFNDQFMELFTIQRQTGRALSPQKAQLVLLALYALDDFKPFLERMGLLNQYDLNPDQHQAIFTNEQDRLAFALSWLKLVLAGGPAARPHEEAST